MILQVLFQFPVKWKAEANEADKNERITIQFQNQDQKSIPRGEGSLQLEMLVFFRGNNEEGDVERNTEETDSEEKASSNLISDINNSGEKASDSSPRNDGRASDSKIFQEETTKEIRPLSEKEVNKIIEKAASKNLDPSDRLILAWSYEGKTDDSGEVTHAISQEFFRNNYTILLNLRGVYKGISVERLIEFKNGKREVNRDDIGEGNKVLLKFEEKPIWDGTLFWSDIPELVFDQEESLSFEAKVTYTGNDFNGKIKYFIKDSKGNIKELHDLGQIVINSPGMYKLIATIPEDPEHRELTVEADLPVRKKYAGKYFLEESQEIPLDEGNKINFKINPDINAKATLEVVKNKNIVNIINNEIWMKNVKGEINIRATVPDWEKDGIPYQGFTDELIVYITPGHQSGFRFASTEYRKGIAEDNDVSIYEYEIPYGLTDIGSLTVK